MISFIVSADRYGQFMYASMGINGIDKKKATSPDTLLERVIDFLTLGKLHKRFATEYDNFTAAVTKAIAESNQDQGRYTIPQELTLDYEGHQVSFTPTHGADDEPTMVIEIAGAVEKKEISQNRYKNFCTLQLLRENDKLRNATLSLTEQGTLNLEGVDLSGLPLSGIDLSHANLSKANFTHADLSGANLEGAWCQETEFTGADLRGVVKMDSVLQQYIEKADKKRTEDIRTLCDEVRKAYAKDSFGNLLPDCNGLFRESPQNDELASSRIALNRGTLAIDKLNLKVKTSLLKEEFRETTPLDKSTFYQIMESPEQTLELYLGKVAEMPLEAGKRCKMILDLYADAYNNADSATSSHFNKTSLLKTAVMPGLFGNILSSMHLSHADMPSADAQQILKSVDKIAQKILEDYLALTQTTVSAHPIDNTVLVVKPKLSAGPVVNDVNGVIAPPPPTLAKPDQAGGKAEYPSQIKTPVPHQDDIRFPGPEQAKGGGRASAPAENPITAETINNVAETKRTAEEKEERAVQAEVKKKRSERHDAAVLDNYAARSVKELTAFFEQLAQGEVR